MGVLTRFCASALMLCLPAWCAADSEDGKDCDGCSDAAVLARYPGAILLGADLKAFDEAVVPSGPSLKGDDGATIAPKTVTLTGKRTRLFYYAPAQRSGLEVLANYRQALENSGMSVVWACSNADCGPEFLGQSAELMHVHLANTPESDLAFTLGETPRYLLAAQARPQGTLHVAVLVADLPDKQRPGVEVIQVEDKSMDKGMAGAPAADARPPVVESKPGPKTEAAVDAAVLGATIASAGQVNVYGIHFDFDKADIQPESKPQLDEIAKLLSANPDLKLRVTGHTDNVGGTEHNQILSRRRADAIVAALTANYGVAPERLTSAGLGASLPVASNDSEEGRARNRRVELIKQ